MSKDKKLQILTQIRNSKHILFGAFSSTLTKQHKVNEWKKILESCKALGLVKDETKDYSYVRDTFWQNIKKTTLAKVDNANQTGSGGGKSSILTEIDDLVLQIIGKDSPSVVGLNQFDLMAEPRAPQTPQPSQNSEDVDDPGSPKELIPKTEEPAPSSSTDLMPMVRRGTLRPKRWITKNSPQHEELKLKRRKLELQIENLELLNHKLKVDILKDEIELGLERSQFTSSLKKQDNF